MNKIIEQVETWEYVKQLPATYAEFSLNSKPKQYDNQYYLFTYENTVKNRKLTVLYDKTTKDFLTRITIGLTEYYDVIFITTELATLERILIERLERTLENLADPSTTNYESIFRSKNILEWPFTSELPAKLANFELFINPQKPVKIINGSYIIIDYSDFHSASNMVVYYNVYRDEFFGEVRIRHTPRMINQFDAEELSDLTEKLKANLTPTLTALRREIDQPIG